MELSSVFITPTLLRVVRVFRIGRVLRLIKPAQGIREFLFALVLSLPALFNITLLLFLLIFIYTVFGMNFWGNVGSFGTFDDIVNFRTFGSSFLLMFRLSTAAGWNDILDNLLTSPPTCNSTYMTMPDGRVKQTPNGSCPNTGLAIFFMVTYVILTKIIVVNL